MAFLDISALMDLASQTDKISIEYVEKPGFTYGLLVFTETNNSNGKERMNQLC